MRYDIIDKRDSKVEEGRLVRVGHELIFRPLGRMLQSEVQSVVIRKELSAKRLLANGLLPYSPDFFLDKVRDAESSGHEIDLVGFSVLADKLKTIFQLVFIVERHTARGGNLSKLRR